MNFRRTKIRLKILARYIIPTIAILLIIPVTQRSNQQAVYHAPIDFANIRCAIAVKEADDTSKVLLAGYCFDMLKMFASDKARSVDIVIEKRGENYIDSLMAGTIDLLALPAKKALSLEDVETSREVEGLFCFVATQQKSAIVRDIDIWVEEFLQSERYKPFRIRFYTSSSPFKRASSENPAHIAGPYDNILKKAAASIDWDWRLLAAMIYQESKFRIDVESRRGALGLMQMMPATAARIGSRNIFDPEECINTGVRYLARLQRMFRPYAANQVELEKMTLAAYNAGEGRIRDCINYGSLLGEDVSTWEGILKVIPKMQDESVLEADSVKVRKFKGLETMAYVDAVQDLYQAFCKICP